MAPALPPQVTKKPYKGSTAPPRPPPIPPAMAAMCAVEWMQAVADFQSLSAPQILGSLKTEDPRVHGHLAALARLPLVLQDLKHTAVGDNQVTWSVLMLA